jgi:hypothetical protein
MKVLDRWAVYYPKERRATSAPLLTTHKKAAVSRTDWAVFVLGICLRNSCSTTELHRRRRGIVAERRAPDGIRVARIAPLCAEVRGS